MIEKVKVKRVNEALFGGNREIEREIKTVICEEEEEEEEKKKKKRRRRRERVMI